mgnify:CR=1 FL=1
MDKSQDSLKKINELIIDLMNFMEVCIHQILYSQRLYPSIVFETKSYLGLEVKTIKKNVLSDYIHEIMEKVDDLTRRDFIEGVQIKILKENCPEYSFEIEIERVLSYAKMENLPDKFELDSNLKRMLYKLISQDTREKAEPETEPTENSKNSFELLIKTNGKEELDEASKLILMSDWVGAGKSDKPGRKKKKLLPDLIDESAKKITPKDIQLIDGSDFAEFSVNIYKLTHS